MIPMTDVSHLLRNRTSTLTFPRITTQQILPLSFTTLTSIFSPILHLIHRHMIIHINVTRNNHQIVTTVIVSSI
ncbi:hypothetical protein Hanom_Chr10g00956061 [Helianthus anomalus]